MDPGDRKRGFSNAFHPSNDPYRKALRSITGSTASSRPSFDTPIVMFGSNKENKEPFFNTTTELMKLFDAPQSHVRQPLGPRFFEPHAELPYDSMDFTMSENPIPLSEQGHQINSSAVGYGSDPCSSSPFDGVLASCSYTEPGPVIFEDPDTPVYDQLDHTGKVTPTDLSFQDLSLQESPETWLPGQCQSPTRVTRTSVFMVESKSLQR